MVHAQPLFQQLVLRSNHIVIVILRKTSVHAVARLARLSVTDVIRQNDVIGRDIQKLPGPNRTPANWGMQKLAAGTSGSVQEQDGIGNFAVRVADREYQRSYSVFATRADVSPDLKWKSWET